MTEYLVGLAALCIIMKFMDEGVFLLLIIAGCGYLLVMGGILAWSWIESNNLWEYVGCLAFGICVVLAGCYSDNVQNKKAEELN